MHTVIERPARRAQSSPARGPVGLHMSRMFLNGNRRAELIIPVGIRSQS